MARLARVVVPGFPHHVVQRGNRRQDVFFSDEDRAMYVEFVRRSAERFGVKVLAWCLMSNHVHFVAVPEGEKSLALCFGSAHTRSFGGHNTQLPRGIGGREANDEQGASEAR